MSQALIRLGSTARSVAVTFIDCDGVIFDSNATKSSAFEHALEGYPRIALDRMLAHHRAFGGVSRYDKLRTFFTEIHPVPNPEPAITAALVRFGERSRRAYLELDPMPHALDFVARMGGAERVYVASGADQAELEGVFEHHRIRDRFAEVLGSPVPKRAHLSRVLAQRGFAASEALMVGDGRADFEAASSLGMPFVFLAAHSDWADGRSHVEGSANGFVAEDWRTLLSWLE